MDIKSQNAVYIDDAEICNYEQYKDKYNKLMRISNDKWRYYLENNQLDIGLISSLFFDFLWSSFSARIIQV